MSHPTRRARRCGAALVPRTVDVIDATSLAPIGGGVRRGKRPRQWVNLVHLADEPKHHAVTGEPERGLDLKLARIIWVLLEWGERRGRAIQRGSESAERQVFESRRTVKPLR